MDKSGSHSLDPDQVSRILKGDSPFSSVLWKKGGFHKAWKQRRFYVQGSKIIYYKLGVTDRIKGSIDLSRATQAAPFEHSKRPYAFVLSTVGREWKLAAESAEERQQWLDVLDAMISEFSSVTTDISGSGGGGSGGINSGSNGNSGGCGGIGGSGGNSGGGSGGIGDSNGNSGGCGGRNSIGNSNSCSRKSSNCGAGKKALHGIAVDSDDDEDDDSDDGDSDNSGVDKRSGGGGGSELCGSGGMDNMQEVEVSRLPLTLSRQAVVLGESRQLAVDQEIAEGLTLTNPEKDKLWFRFVIPEDPARFHFSVTPAEGCVRSMESVVITLRLTPLCTARVKDFLAILVWRGGAKAITHPSTTVFHGSISVSYESLLSPKLDPSEVKLFECIGEGGYGVVRRGSYRGLEVAVKTLKTMALVQNIAEEFRKEVSFLERLRHPNIVNLVGFLHTPTQLSVVTEYCPYGNFDAALAGHPKSFSLALRLRCIQDTAKGMDFLHQSNIIHRDLKPQNVLITSLEPCSSVVAKITDFGTVRDLVSSSALQEGSSQDSGDRKKPLIDVTTGDKGFTKGVGTGIFMVNLTLRTLTHKTKRLQAIHYLHTRTRTYTHTLTVVVSSSLRLP